jgi:hypothetical protein
MTAKPIVLPTSYTTEVPTTFLHSSPELRVFLVVDIALLVMACLGLIYVIRHSFLTNRSKRRHNLGFKSRQRFPCKSGGLVDHVGRTTPS